MKKLYHFDLHFYQYICPQVKPKLAQVRDISKKTNKDNGDDAGIFMGDCEYDFSSTILKSFY